MENVLCDEDIDAILTVIENDVFATDASFNADMVKVLISIEESALPIGLQCDVCSKVWKSKQGLARHKTLKHLPARNLQSESTINRTADSMPHPLQFKRMINETDERLSLDKCYSDETRGTFKDYQVDLDDAIYYNFIKDVITDFHGDGEKFYPTFYKADSEELLAFKNLSRRCSVLLGFEVANLVLAHLSRTATTEENEVAFQPAEFTLKDRNIVNYLRGYVFATLYRRIRKSKQCISNVHSTSILLAGKCGEDNNIPPPPPR